ncbi:MAG: pyruvate kinase [Planctomycetes bacterium]|nr:pyruvate kinase [Planctomycetota bacterium]
MSTTITAETMTAATTDVEPQPTTGGLSEAVSNIDRRKTKIVCTVGPACSTPEQIRALIEAGANVFRLNFSHADHPWHTAAITTIRAAADKLQVPVAVMQDLCGPKIRLSRVVEENYTVTAGDLIRVTTERHLAADGPAISFDIASTYAALLDDVGPGDVMLFDDGRLEVCVEEHQGNVIVVRVVRGGPLSVGKGINLPGVSLSTDSVTQKDWQDLEWGIEHDVDYVALSFVRHPDDVAAVQSRLAEAGSRAQVIAKIERPEAIEHIDAIARLADGLMVARGDLGLETDLARVPVLQKHLIERCRRLCKPVITATQMLESMVHNAVPTRAEVSDVANAIYDGSDAIMLSGETAAGKHPVRAVEMLDHVARVTEADLRQNPEAQRRQIRPTSTVAAVVEGAITTAIGVGARRVVIYSQSGSTARALACHRLPMPVVALTHDAATYRQLSLSFGIEPLLLPSRIKLPKLLDDLDILVARHRWGSPGDLIIVVSALDGEDGNTDTMHIHTVR